MYFLHDLVALKYFESLLLTIKIRLAYFASNARAKTPAASGAAADVPE